ncbi:MAG: MFS transporter [Alphaproteobacteria bacterium]|nr:MFS transporter [Alphaproteobacteria bacterium]
MTKKPSSFSLASYGQIALPLAIADLPIVIYLTPFFGGDIGVNIQVLAWILLGARLADVLIDPCIGILSDRSVNAPIGRRKLFILLGIPVKMLGIYMIMFAEPGVSWAYVLLWIVVFYLGLTMITIPYGALGAELSNDYLQRTRITGWRALFTFAGILIATIAPILTGGGAGTPEGLTPVMQGLGLWSLIAFPVSAFLIGFFVPEPPVRDSGTGVDWFKGLKVAASNGAFMRILGATVVGRIGAAINAAATVWFFLFAMGLGPASGLPVIVYLLTAVLGVPIWVIVGDRISKHRAMCFASMSSVVTFGALIFAPKGDLFLSCFIMALAGLGGSAAATLGQSIAADVLDLDELRSRQSRAGLLLAFWAMGGKLADAVGGFLALMILASFGFSPQTMANAPDAVWGLTLTYIVMPWPFYFLSILLLWNFPITRERQARIRRLVERRALRIQAAMPSPAQ